ncbi:hypothetical protein Tco_0907153 [Tanacetum coccineum]|uniref:Uncharacterized protein n=1 Tax=Tanacetum coccineum TaxID=301880 RepID=A0ABQ5CLS9_9ASTR
MRDGELNINELGLEYGRYGVSKVLDTAYRGFLRAQIRRIFLDGYGILVVRIVIFKISSFKLQNACLLVNLHQDTESNSSSSCLEALKKYDNVLPLIERQIVQYLQKVSRVLYNILIKDQWEKHEKAAVSYANLMSKIKGFHNASYKVHRGTEDAFSRYGKLLDAVKEDPALKKKVIKATEAYTKNSTNLIELLSLIKSFDFWGLNSSVESLQASALRQDEHLAEWAKSSTFMAWNLGLRMTTPSTSVQTTTLVITKGPITIKGENFTHAATEEPPSQTEGENNNMETQVTEVVQEEATKACVDPKILASVKGGQEFKKIQDVELQVLNREHSLKVKRQMELRNKRLEQYMWTTSSILKPKPITNFKIHPNNKPVVLTVYRGNDRRNFDVHNPFKFVDFGITELGALGPIIENKNNKIVVKLMISLGKRYKRMNKIPKELRIQSALPASL